MISETYPRGEKTPITKNSAYMGVSCHPTVTPIYQGFCICESVYNKEVACNMRAFLKLIMSEVSNIRCVVEVEAVEPTEE